MEASCDIVIIGGGVIGCMIARALACYRLQTILIEKEADIGVGASFANTAIIHAGYDPTPGSLKAEMNITGNMMWEQLAQELHIPFERCGDYVVAIGPDELPRLDALMQQGRQNGVPGMQIISGEEMRKREPQLNPAASGALWAPTGGLCEPFSATLSAAENAIQNGTHLRLETAFLDFIWQGKRIVGVQTSRGPIHCRWVINAAGLFADEVMHKAGIRPEFKIFPRRGEYLVFDEAELPIKNILFPVPTEISKGILVTASLHGNPLVGPTAQSGTDKEDRGTTTPGLDEVIQGAQKMIPSINLRHVIAMFAGLRATGNAPCQRHGVSYNADFIIEIPSGVTGLVNLGGIESPGLTSAPAIAQRVVELLKDAGEPLLEKRDWNPLRPARPRFNCLSRSQQSQLIARDPRYGRVVCRCEGITEGEIVAEIHGLVPARTYDAIKRRTWAGMGRCQGSFDLPRVVAILARELGISPLEVTKRGPGSQFLVRLTKDVEAEDVL
jgi:glycerol-3-phosphate dehydrogenase